MGCACGVARCTSSLRISLVVPHFILLAVLTDPSNKQLCWLQMDLERRYAAVLHKVVRRINGKLGVVLQHLLAVQQRNEEDGPTLPQRLAPVLDMYTYVCGCKALCMTVLPQHMAHLRSMWASVWRQLLWLVMHPLHAGSAIRQPSCVESGCRAPAGEMQAQPTGSVLTGLPVTTSSLKHHGTTKPHIP